jgi:hypothetical protein
MSSYGENLFCDQLRLKGQTPLLPGKWLNQGVTGGTTATATATVADTDFKLGETNYIYCVLSTPTSPVPSQTLTITMPSRFSWDDWTVEVFVQYATAPSASLIYEIIEQTGPDAIQMRRANPMGNVAGVDNTKLYFRVMPRGLAPL